MHSKRLEVISPKLHVFCALVVIGPDISSKSMVLPRQILGVPQRLRDDTLALRGLHAQCHAGFSPETKETRMEDANQLVLQWSHR